MTYEDVCAAQARRSEPFDDFDTPLTDILSHAIGASERDPLEGLIHELAFIAKAMQNRCDQLAGGSLGPAFDELESGAGLLATKAQALQGLLMHLQLSTEASWQAVSRTRRRGVNKSG